MTDTFIFIIVEAGRKILSDVFKLTRLSYIVVFGSSIPSLIGGIVEPTIAPYLEELGASNERIGNILAMRWLIVALASIPFALLASRIGYIKVLYIASIGPGLAGICLYFLNGVNAVIFFYLFLGLSGAASSGPGAAILAENEGTKRVAAFALFSITWMIPPALGAAISMYWFRTTTTYNPGVLSTIFILVLIFGIIGFGIFAILLIKYRSDDKSTENEIIPIKAQFELLFIRIVVIPVILLMLVNFLSG
ncbi:MAG: MFS transporter, partial [Candidatus Heimdallarchaeota archaeon]|nr:MFS transporter [Candidatus Heimdallarchaeota archaeon]